MRWYGGIAGFLCLLCLTSCSACKISADKGKDLTYELVEEADIPEEMKNPINKRQKKPFYFTYADDGWLYIARGYGEQETDGYEIQVEEFYESENAVFLKTEFLGSEPDEDIKDQPTCPYIVIRTEYTNKYVAIE